jgi:hypothetical protein
MVHKVLRHDALSLAGFDEALRRVHRGWVLLCVIVRVFCVSECVYNTSVLVTSPHTYKTSNHLTQITTTQCQPDVAVERHANLAKDAEFHFCIAIGLARQRKFLMAAAALRQALVLAPDAHKGWRDEFRTMVKSLPPQQQAVFADGIAPPRRAITAEPCAAGRALAPAEDGSYEHADCTPAANGHTSNTTTTDNDAAADSGSLDAEKEAAAEIAAPEQANVAA